MSEDQVWFIENGPGEVFSAVKYNNTFVLNDALCHIYFGPWDFVQISKRHNAEKPGEYEEYPKTLMIVEKVDRNRGVLCLTPA